VARDHQAEVVYLGTIGPRQCAIDTLIRQLQSKRQQLVFGYEAGPCGDWLSRYLPKRGPVCRGVAPSLSPQKAGDRVKTDRRDAVQWARLMRSGALTAVDVPTLEDEALRDRRRAREDALRDRKAAQCRLKAFLLRHALRYMGRATWGPAPRRGLSEGVCATPAPHIVFQEDVRAVTEPTARLQRLEPELHDPVHTWRLAPVLEALQARRGVPFTVAVTTGAERGDLPRFATPRQRMQFLGLIPAEYASGERRRQGSPTTAGHTHARRALGDGAWASRYPARVSRHLPLRRERPPKALQALSWKAQVRRCKRVRRLMARGKHATQVVGAIARALVGLMWASAKEIALTP
jgi:transposase